MKIFLFVFVFIILGAGIFIILPSIAPVTSPSPAPQQNIASNYVPYSKAALDAASSKRRVLFFYANWCPTCRPADADFQKTTSQIPPDVVVIRVNYNDTETDQEEKALAAKYGVTYQHTFVQIDGSGNEVTKWNGGQTAELLSNLK